MKILIVDTYYSKFLNQFYLRFPNVKVLDYKKHLAALMDMKFGTADFYSKNLKLLGHKAKDVVINDEILQKKWAKEHRVFRSKYWLDKIPYLKFHFKSNWQEEILERQILAYKPDILYCQDLSLPGADFINKIKQKMKVFIVGQIASPVNFDKEFLLPYNLVLSSLPNFVERFRSMEVKSEYFRIGFEETILGKLQKTKQQYDATFIGGFSKRHQNNNVLAAATDVWGYGAVPALEKYHGETWGSDMYNIFFNSKITLNRHIDVAEDHANNMRLYESTGVGTMLITDYKSDLNKLFIPGKEVETYKTKEELIKKVQYYLTHEKERLKIAKAGQKRTLRDHTYKKRMEELILILNKYL